MVFQGAKLIKKWRQLRRQQEEWHTSYLQSIPESSGVNEKLALQLQKTFRLRRLLRSVAVLFWSSLFEGYM